MGPVSVFVSRTARGDCCLCVCGVSPSLLRRAHIKAKVAHTDGTSTDWAAVAYYRTLHINEFIFILMSVIRYSDFIILTMFYVKQARK